MGDLVFRLRNACVGKPAKIPWPHRLLHEAADTIEAAQADADRLAEALDWYAEKAEALVRYQAREGGPNTDAMMAVYTELTLDGGQRAAKAKAAHDALRKPGCRSVG